MNKIYRLAVIPNLRIAQIFVDYMATQNVLISMQKTAEGIELWLVDEGQINIAEQELTKFISDPLNDRYLAASWQVGSTKLNIPYHSDSILSAFLSKTSKLTLIVIIICIVFYAASLLLGRNGVIKMLEMFSFPGGSEQYSQIWRWITPIFIHMSVAHIAFNLLWYWVFGGLIERNQGSGRLLVITLLSAVISNLSQAIASNNIYFGGLSGVVYATLGYCWLYGVLKPDNNVKVSSSLMLFFIIFMVIEFMTSNYIPIANAAHFAGLCVGLALAAWHGKVLSR